MYKRMNNWRDQSINLLKRPESDNIYEMLEQKVTIFMKKTESDWVNFQRDFKPRSKTKNINEYDR